VQRTADAGSGYNVGYTRQGEWLEYTVDVAAAGAYSLDVRLANAQSIGGTFHLESDGVNVTGPITAPSTGGWQTWQTITRPGVNLSAGKHVLRLVFDRDGNGGAIANFNWLRLTKTGTIPQPPPPPVGLPAPWKDQDIGAVGASGSASFSNGTYTVSGSGSDIWGNSDSFHFAYQQVSGDGTFTVRVASMQAGDFLQKAGIMVRETLAANSKQAGLFIMPASGVRFIRRDITGGGSTAATSTVNTGILAPYWLRLTRSGSTFSAFRSIDGVNWVFVGSQQINMSQSVFIGMAVTSHQAGVTRTAVFDNVVLN
jgi:regulation of enolase protein 1 (concanavalin A-like superfamily)